MDFNEVVKTRRSVRSFRPDSIPEAVLQSVLNAARIAPSGGNRQPSRMILVKDKSRREALVPMCNGQKFVSEAPVIVVACGQESRTNRGGYMGKLSMLVDVSIAVDHLTLAARAQGLGTCWIGAFSNSELKKYLGIPEDFQVVAVVPLGYPAGEPFIEVTDRMPLEQIVCDETWKF